jgi:CheY-like chemotaxis protein
MTAIDADPPKVALSVLVVEDDEASRYATHRFLESVGCVVTSVMSAMLALDALEKASFDVVVIDCVMPPGTLNGVALGRMINHRYPLTPFLFVTGYLDILAEKDLMPDAPILLKPFNLAELHAAIAMRVPGHGESFVRQIAERGDHNPFVTDWVSSPSKSGCSIGSSAS